MNAFNTKDARTMAEANIQSGINKHSFSKVVTTDIQNCDENLSPSKTSEVEGSHSKDAKGQAVVTCSERSEVAEKEENRETCHLLSDTSQSLRSSFRGGQRQTSGQNDMPSPPMLNKSLSDTSPNTSLTSNSKETNPSSVLPKIRARGQGLVSKRHQRPFSSASLYNHQSFTSLPRSNVRRNTTNSKLSVFDTAESTNASQRNSLHSSVPPQMPSSRMFNAQAAHSDYFTHVKTANHQPQRERVKTFR